MPKKLTKAQQFAEDLAFGPFKLDDRGLSNYLVECERMIENEIQMGRSPKTYQMRAEAARMAMTLRGLS